MSLPAQVINLATRESPLAMVQTRWIQSELLQRDAALCCKLVPMTTRGDQVLDRPLAAIGGKGLFIKELEHALLAGQADIAVHSAKDVPMQVDPRFALAFIAPRETPFDAWVSHQYAQLSALPAGAKVGTSSLRRAVQLRLHYPLLDIQPLRGNVNTRLKKLDSGEFSGIILAAAGLQRLGLAPRIRSTMPLELSIPAIAQGVLAVEYLAERNDIAQRLAALQTAELTACVTAERTFGRVLNGSCEVPLAGYARLEAGVLHLMGMIATPDGSTLVQGQVSGTIEQAAALGLQLGDELRARGGAALATAIQLSYKDG